MGVRCQGNSEPPADGATTPRERKEGLSERRKEGAGREGATERIEEQGRREGSEQGRQGYF